MTNSFSRIFRGAVRAGVATIALAPALAFAQDGAASEDDANTAGNEIVVTGSLIRGAAPVGSNFIAVDEAKLQSTGTNSANELLATLPQITNYFNRSAAADLGIAVIQVQVARPNIRNISPLNASSSATLVLVDGHRIATSGVSQASIDPDSIPNGAIERVEVVTEGGSATYGADAVAGVINFITRKRFDGLKVDGHYGFGNDYWQWDASATAGKDWGTGSAYISYSYAKTDALFGRDRDYIRNVDYTKEPYTGLSRQCLIPNVRVTGTLTYYSYPNLTTPSPSICDSSDDRAFIPATKHQGVAAGLHQELGDSTTVDIRAFWGRRESLAVNSKFGTVSVPSTNFYYQPIPSNPKATQTVDFSFAPALGRDAAHASTLIENWGANAEFTQKLGENWKLRALFNYSRSNSAFDSTGISATRLNAAGAGTTAATAINPYNILATNPAVLADLGDSETAGQAKDDLFNLRGVLDGRLFSLPGGDLRVALGYEYVHDGYKQRYFSDIRIGTLASRPFLTYGRHVHSFFGEVNVPVFGPDNATAGIDSFVIAASARYDSYSDFGNTFNPKIGATYKPVSWLAIRGNWGTSFTAPTPLDQLRVQRTTFLPFGFAAFVKPSDNPLPGGITAYQTLSYQGALPNLRPQTADTWSVGFDADPPFIPGLHASLSYYNVKFKNILATPSSNVGIFTNFPNNIISNKNGIPIADLQKYRTADIPTSGPSIDQVIADGRPVYEIVDFRTGNYGTLWVDGLDFDVRYRHEAGFGSFDVGVNGNLQLKRKSQVSASSPIVDVLHGDVALSNDGASALAVQTTVGANIGGLRAQASWNYSGGYDIVPTTSVPVQDTVGSYSTVNLFFKYDVPGDSVLLKNLSFTVNVNNVFDKAPPILRRNLQNEFGFPSTFLNVGRMVIVGVSKQF